MIKLVGNRIAVLPLWDRYSTSNGMSVLNLEGGKGYDFNEYAHAPRTGIVKIVSDSYDVSDEYRTITNLIPLNSEVLFPHDAISSGESITYKGEELFIIPITNIYAWKDNGSVWAASDTILCERIAKRNFLGMEEEASYKVLHVSYNLMHYDASMGFSYPEVKVGDRLILGSDPYLLEDRMHQHFFSGDTYAVPFFDVKGKEN